MTVPLQFNSIAAVQLPAHPLHLAIGMFDGVHLGHRAVIEPAITAARNEGGIAAVLTFWPHPSALFRPEARTRMIQTPETKALVLQRLGIDAIITEPFTRDFAAIPAAEFLPWLKARLPSLRGVYVGENFRFGHQRLGNPEILRATGIPLGIAVHSVPRLARGGDRVSSTRIRTLLEAGELESANALLGYPYFSVGRVTPGKQLGRTIGFPTLNVPWSPDLRPRLGVYAVRVSRADDGVPALPGLVAKPESAFGREGAASLPGVANYGVRPTVEQSSEPRLEIHVLGACPFETGDRVCATWEHFIRPEVKFGSLDALKAQIARDRETAGARLGLSNS